MRFPIIYLPVEFRSREFDSKVLLAATLAERGYSVVVGQQWMLNANIPRLPPGVFLFKGFNKIHQASMLQARRSGHRVVILEEELLGQIEERAIVAMCAEGVFGLADLVIANGEFEAGILRRAGGTAFRMEIAGNGRIDLLKPRYHSFFAKPVADVRSRYGDFVLVNTNFQIVNSIWNSIEEVTRIQLQAGFVRPNDPASMQTWKDYVAFEEANRKAMHVAIRMLAERRPGQRIVVRPHPGEDLRRWDGLFSDFRNVVVVREGSHVPWTLACRVLMHSSCTTGFEAHVAGKPALSLVPSPGWISGSTISNQVNPIIDTPEEMVGAVERTLEGETMPADGGRTATAERYVWNYGENDGTRRIADLLTEGLPAPQAIPLPPLQEIARDQRLKEKFDVAVDDGRETFLRMRAAAGLKGEIDVQSLGDSLFLVRPAAMARSTVSPGVASGASAVPIPREQILAAMNSACATRDFAKAYDIFKENFGEAHRIPQACFLAGVALFELARYPLALQYFEQATVADPAPNPHIMAMLARTHQKLGQLDLAYRFAQQVYRMMATDRNVFSLFKELCEQTGRKAPEHWLVIGCSHVRYFRYLQVNQPKFFGDSVHLECVEMGGATAFGLGNTASQSGALKATRDSQGRINVADRVIVHFGEIDCRRAAWKAAAVDGRAIEETIKDSAAHLEAYVTGEILPHNRNVLILGAKPQIIADDDFYKNSLEDDRTPFQPLAERERITLLFNDLLRQSAARLGIDYADIDHVLTGDEQRRQFFDRAFWDSYTTDTHGRADLFAELYYEKLKPFVGLKRDRR